MLAPSAQAGGIFALYRKNRIVMPIFTKWRKSANLFFCRLADFPYIQRRVIQI